MFKDMLRKLSEINYILVIDNGRCELVDKNTRKVYLSFKSSESTRMKERLLLNFYLETD